ncbi:hypothetical protein [Rhodanobacter sp. C01]|uniref:hypothetical protein n=1 Tax=Rhodanobacter sp. C01 TaxID=1945856 RepID=UPI0011159843|nr:hypothetical protein [Rhodanobacter sp. C01]
MDYRGVNQAGIMQNIAQAIGLISFQTHLIANSSKISHHRVTDFIARPESHASIDTKRPHVSPIHLIRNMKSNAQPVRPTADERVSAGTPRRHDY